MIRLKSLLKEDIENLQIDTSEKETTPDYQLLYDGWLDRGVVAANHLVSKGYSKIIAAAFIGNFAVESGVRPDVSQNLTKPLKLGFGFKPPTLAIAAKQPASSGYGLAQWTADRKSKLIANSASTTTQQLNFVVAELKGSQSSAWERIKDTKTLAKAVEAIVTYYERAGKPVLSKRISKATEIYDRIK